MDAGPRPMAPEPLQLRAATNLLHQALRALDNGDEDGARRFVEQAVALPYDEHQRMHPAAMMAQQQLLSAVTDALDNGGDDWLYAATDAFRSAPQQARYTLRDVLKEVIHGRELSDGEEWRLRRITKDVPERSKLPNLELSPEQLAPAVLEVLEGVIHFVDAYEESIAFTCDED